MFVGGVRAEAADVQVRFAQLHLLVRGAVGASMGAAPGRPGRRVAVRILRKTNEAVKIFCIEVFGNFGFSTLGLIHIGGSTSTSIL